MKSFLILFWIFAELYNCWRIVECCKLAQCICSLILCILWCFTDCDPCTLVLLVRWLLVALHFYMFRDWYTVHSCLFADDGAFILASTLVPVEEFDDQSAWLRAFGGSTFLLDAWNRHVLKKWNNKEKLNACKVIIVKLWNEWSLCWFCFEFWPNCTILLVVECCRLAQCICSVILCIFCDVTDCDPRTSVRLVRWLHCIFACLEIDILYTLAFSQKMELLYSRAH